MKKICSVLTVLVLLGTAVWAQDAAKTDQTLLEAKAGKMTVTVYGDANARFGMQSMTADNTNPWSSILMSGLSGNSDNFATDLTAAQTAFGGALVQKILLAGGNLAAVTGEEKALAVSAGFTATIAGNIATAYATAEGTTPGSGPAAAAAKYGEWANAGGGIGMALKDATLAGYMNEAYTKTGMYYGLKNENAVKLGTKLASTDGKFTADVSAKYTSGAYSSNPVDIQTAWFKYDLGPLAVKYNSHDGNQHWDSDILYVGDNSLQNALDFQIKPVDGIGYAFFTIMSNEAVTSGVKYFNTEFRTVPMMQLGYVYSSKIENVGEVEGTIGSALDKPTKDGGDYLGYLVFGGAKFAKGTMASETGSLVIGLNGVYGHNTSTLAGMNSADMEQATLGVSNIVEMLVAGDSPILRTVSATADDDSVVAGGRLYGGYTMWTGGIASLDARVSQLTFAGDSDPFTAMRFTGGLTQFLSENFNVTLGGGYEKYSVQAGDVDFEAAHGYEITLDIGYRF